MRKIVLIFIAAALISGCSKAPQTVHMYGQLVDMGSTTVTMRYDGAASAVGDSRDILLQTDDQGMFDTVIPLNEPSYFRISRNTLYLTPGDDLKVYITSSNTDATFEGRGAEANNYMKFRLFPKGGSFLEGGRNVRGDFTQTIELIDSLAEVRKSQLDALSNVSDQFKKLEAARIRADVVNSYFSYMYYSDLFTQARSEADPQQAMQRIATEFLNNDAAPVANPIIKGLTDDDYLDVAVVRDVFSGMGEPEYEKVFAGVPSSSRREELFRAAGYSRELGESINQQVIDEFTTKAAQLQNEDFKSELVRVINERGRLLPGQPAPDFEIVTADGTRSMLSDLKGKVLYVDFWATWCGPCKYESPFFHDVAAKYCQDDILFVQISTDTNHKAWLDYLEKNKSPLPQYNSTDNALSKGWAIQFIPRFILIDRDFNIIDANAIRPSEEGVHEVLVKAVGK